jgi:hypothetical protein
MPSTSKLAAGAVLCLIAAGCGGASPRPDRETGVPPAAGETRTAVEPRPTTFKGGYERAWAQMTQVGAGVAGAINQVRRARARHETVADARIAREFAALADKFEPAVIQLQELTPPAKVARAYRSLSTAALGMSGTLRSFSFDAGANRAGAAGEDLASYYSYAATIDRDATTVFDELGIK